MAMTKADKAFLRWVMRNKPERTNKDIADDIGCTVATVRKYRRALVKDSPNDK